MEKGNKLLKKAYLLITISIIIFSFFYVIDQYSLVGKTFSGFTIGSTLVVDPFSKKNWTGYKYFKDYDLIIAVNGEKIRNIDQFNRIIHKFKPSTSVEYTFIRNNTQEMKVSIKTMEFTKKDFITTFLKTLLISLVYLIITLFIIIKSRLDESIQALIMFTLFMSFSFTTFNDLNLVYKFVPLTIFVQIFTLSSLVNLGLILNKNNFTKKTFNILSITNIVIATIWAFTFSITIAIIIPDIYQYPLITWLHFKVFFFSVYGSASVFFIFSSLILYGYFKSPNLSLHKMQNRIIFTGAILSFTPYIFLWIINSLFNYNNTLENIILSFIAFPFFLIYAIVRYKAFDIEIFIRKGLIYGSLSGLLVLSYLSISTISALLSKTFFEITGEIPIVISTVIATLITSKFSTTIQNLIDKAFYRQKFNLSLLLEEFINEINEIFDRNDLIKKCFDYLEKSLLPVFSGLYLLNNNNRELILLGTNGEELPLKVDISSDNNLNKIFDDYNGISVPLQNNKEIFGVLVVGNKKAETEYFFEEKLFLKSFSSRLSIALNNILIREESFVLYNKNIELENKALFLNQLTSNLSHDLKFPVISGKTILNKIKYQMDKKTEISKEWLQEELKKLDVSLKKVIEYITISLDKEMISIGKLVLAKEEVNIKDACRDAILIHSEYLKSKNIKINYTFPENEIYILGDRVRFENVISNLISNAGKYVNASIILKAYSDDTNVIIEVKDDGNGIREDLKDKIFERFVHSEIKNQSTIERSTGIGLFICKTYIEKMNGKIWFQSENGEGTIFFVSIPLLKNEFFE